MCTDLFKVGRLPAKQVQRYPRPALSLGDSKHGFNRVGATVKTTGGL